MRNLKLTIEFDGSRYKGWQNQKDKEQTVQGKIETVLSKMTGEEIEVIGCERIDTGAHADGYIANFKTNCELSCTAISIYLYEFLPEDILVKFIEEVDERFHARYNAKAKVYEYVINNNNLRNVFNRKYSYHIDIDLNIEEMLKAAEAFKGKHDFKAFTNLKSSAKSTVRTVEDILIKKDNGLIKIELIADDFLLNMERIIVGTLIEVGKGNVKATNVFKMLKDGKKIETIPMAQAKALFLKKVIY
ncbi:tRNA pseudouridine(38-40) synthase TruA [Clostridium cellulovorans]|uniref:tRNA pseudouridine synthase A n=1 Tax=Clostridium cellulovorans (strain ATCC 35296 / DSM 3052 / OCM 3 / 743B) TaxID=573061 RepID=D9SVC9_CLOC7|nr:tRNA pseudouridine(38-40) synthase TruA [Clostridium cellulovorans]ADL51053.1 tRNA pseudouridine synthase A [Clostridium cellulovorans 743B]